MANNDSAKVQTSALPVSIVSMLVFAIAGAILVGLSFEVIRVWPWPVAVAPYFEDSLFATGATWGFVVGAFIGWMIGWLTDESHFIDTKYE